MYSPTIFIKLTEIINFTQFFYFGDRMIGFESLLRVNFKKSFALLHKPMTHWQFHAILRNVNESLARVSKT